MPAPMYHQIADNLRQKIESGELRPGTQLPTELQLREQYNNASRNTVRDAIKWLIGRGLVETRPGHGTFVVEKIDPFVTTLDISGREVEGTTSYASDVTGTQCQRTVSNPRVEMHQASGVVARELEVDEGTPVVSRHQQRFIDEVPWSMQTSFYPMRLVDKGARDLLQAVDMPDGAVRYIENVVGGAKQVGRRDTIAVRAPDPNEAVFFRLPDDGRVAVFELFQTGFDQSGSPLRLTVTVYPADRNQLRIDAGSVPSEKITQLDSEPARLGTTSH